MGFTLESESFRNDQEQNRRDNLGCFERSGREYSLLVSNEGAE